MKRRAFSRLLLSSCLGLAAGVLVANATARAAPRLPFDIGGCVEIEEVEGEDGSVQAQLNSSCEHDVDCRVSWSTACDDGSKQSHHEETFELRAGEISAVDIEAPQCESGRWEVQRISWGCAAIVPG